MGEGFNDKIRSAKVRRVDWERRKRDAEEARVDFGKKVRDAREALGWTRGQFAELLGVSLSAVVLWERNERVPRNALVVLETIAGLGKSPNPRAGAHGPAPKRAKKGGK